MWDLLPRSGIKPRHPALGAQSLGHWTTREDPGDYLGNFLAHPGLVISVLLPGMLCVQEPAGGHEIGAAGSPQLG